MNSESMTPDQAAAHMFLTELRTRISTQRLPYQHGVEEKALESLYKLFDYAREAMKAHPGCEEFAQKTTHMLNVQLRPVTAKWHRAKEAGRLVSRDGADEFRGDLLDVQEELREFAKELHKMAYGSQWTDKPTPEALTTEQLDTWFKPLPFGIPKSQELNGGIRENEVEPINNAEAQAVSERRGNGDGERTDAVGLAFSGGGIRSATFCLGVSQILAEKGLLENVDFLSTVSGGGYTGSFLNKHMGAGEPVKAVAGPHGPDPRPIQALRQRAKFLAARSLWESWGMVTTTLAGMILNWTVPLLVLMVCALIVTGFKLIPGKYLWASATIISAIAVMAANFTDRQKRRVNADPEAGAGPMLGWASLALVIFGVGLVWNAKMDMRVSSNHLWATLMAFSAVVTAAGGLGYFRELRRSKPVRAEVTGRVFGWASLALVVLGIGWALNGGFEYIFHKTASGAFLKSYTVPLKEVSDRASAWSAWFAGLGGLGIIIPVVMRFVPFVRTPLARKVVIKIALIIAGISIPLLGIAVYYLLRAIGLVHFMGIPGWFFLITLALFLVLVAVLVLNINVTGPHRLYRNGLDRTFVQGGQDGGEALELATSNSSGKAPYHLINTAVNLPTSGNARMSERKSDFFMFSKHWTGSPVVGYRKTSEWKMNGRPVDLGTAMAISGAAFSANMGLGSIPPLRALLAFLNVRLGFWIRQPHMKGFWKFPAWEHPGFLCLLREMSGLGMEETHRWLNLSDGGHIENLAIYELLRRRCKFIISVDGEADPAFTFQGLMTLVRHAQIDLGVHIDSDLTDLRCDPKSGCSNSHFHLWRITYPEKSEDGTAVTGFLLYIKLSVTGNESELIKRYRINNPDFPHQTTLDQFFDEEQFEAYRQLGVHAAEGLFSPCLLKGDRAPSTVADWFRRLAGNLLRP